MQCVVSEQPSITLMAVVVYSIPKHKLWNMFLFFSRLKTSLSLCTQIWDTFTMIYNLMYLNGPKLL